jgi:hypothetical protein
MTLLGGSLPTFSCKVAPSHEPMLPVITVELLQPAILSTLQTFDLILIAKLCEKSLQTYVTPHCLFNIFHSLSWS